MVARVYSIMRVLVLLGIIGYLGWYIVLGWTAVKTTARQWDGLTLVGALGAGLLAYQCLFVGWVILIRRTGYFAAHHLPMYSRIWWVSYLYRYVPGRIMVVVERARMGAAVGIPHAPGAALAIIETLFSILAAAWVSLLAVSYYGAHQDWWLWFVALLSVGILLGLPAGYRLLCSHSGLKNRFPELASVELGPRDLLVTMPWYVLHFLCLGLSFFLCARAWQLFSWSALPGLCGVYAFSHLVGLVTLIAPGGLGVREATLSLQLSRMLPSGVSETVAVGARGWFTVLELISLGAVVLLSPRLPEPAVLSETKVTPQGKPP